MARLKEGRILSKTMRQGGSNSFIFFAATKRVHEDHSSCRKNIAFAPRMFGRCQFWKSSGMGFIHYNAWRWDKSDDSSVMKRIGHEMRVLGTQHIVEKNENLVQDGKNDKLPQSFEIAPRM